MSDKDFLMLCVKDLHGELNSQEKAILKQGLQNSEENQELYNQYKRIHELKRNAQYPISMNKQMVWNELYDKITRDQKEQFNPNWIINSLFKLQAKKYVRLGFALSLLILFLFMISDIQHYFLSAKTEFVTTQNKETRTVILPDQSIVILNSKSQIKYPKVFDSNERFVELDGEAFFSIIKDRIPFIVRSNNASISVLGTEFNVWARENETRIAVKNGHVKFYHLEDDDDFVHLYQNQMSVIEKDQKPLTPKDIDLTIYLDWLDNKLIFNKTPLSEVVGEIERYYDVNIQLDNQLKDRLLTAQFTDTSIEPVLDKICLVFHASYNYKDEVYHITF